MSAQPKGIRRKVSFAEAISFTRATAAWGNGGQHLQEVASGDRRIVFDPATGARRGLLIEEQRTNSLLDNRDLSTGSWSLVNSLSVAKNEVGLDGVANTAQTLTDSSGNLERAEQTLNVSDDSNTHILSSYWHKTKGTSPAVVVDLRLLNGTTPLTYRAQITLADGSVVASNDAIASDVSVVDAGDWWRLIIAGANNSTGNTALNVRLFPAGTDAASTGSAVYDFGQVELDASYATSPVETGGSAVTRSADDGTSTIGTEFNAEAFSIVIKGRTNSDFPTTSKAKTVFEYSLSGNNRILGFYSANSDSLQLVVTTGGAEEARLDLGQLSADSDFKLACAFENNRVAASVNGGAVADDTSVALPSGLATRYIGQTDGNSAQWDSTIGKITEHPRAMTDAELIEASRL